MKGKIAHRERTLVLSLARPHFFDLLDYVTHRSENWDFQEKDLEIQW